MLHRAAAWRELSNSGKGETIRINQPGHADAPRHVGATVSEFALALPYHTHATRAF